MMKRVWLITLLFFCYLLGSSKLLKAQNQPWQGPRVVLVIRHAEKPETVDDEKNPNLSARGFERADGLAKTLPALFPRPDFLFATRRSKSSNRPVETITPLAKALNEQIDSTFADDKCDELAHQVLTDPKFDGKVILIAWHHGKIPALAKALGINNAPDKWDSGVFDRVWEVSFKNGVASWKDLPEKTLPGDSQK